MIQRLFPLVFVCILSGSPAHSTPIAFGETIMQAHPTPSATFSYETPHLDIGDVLFVRVNGTAMAPKFQLFTPSGTSVGIYTGMYYRDAQAIYQIPAGAETGSYTIVVSDATLIYSGSFCISIDRMNSSPASAFLPCSQTVSRDLPCPASIQSLRYLVQSGSLSRITISPISGNLFEPEAWLCDKSGNIIRHEAETYGQSIVFDSIPAPATECFYVFVTDGLGFYDGAFSISHNLITGQCAGALNTNTPGNSICEGSSFSMGISGTLPNTTFQWSGPNGFTSDQPQILIDPITLNMAGTYQVTVTSPSVCTGMYSKTITVNPLPTAIASIDPAKVDFCEGEIFYLNVTTNAQNPVTYKWTGPAGFSSGLKSTSVYAQDSTRSGNYIIAVTDGKGCIKRDTIPVTVHAPPTLLISQPSPNGACQGATLQLFAQTNALNPVFKWTGPNGFISTLQNPQIPNAGNANDGTYFVTVTDAYGCTENDLKYIPVWDLPNAVITPSTATICADDSVKLVSGGGILYGWSTTETTKEIYVKPDQSSTYTVTVTDGHGCTDSATATVTVKPLPLVDVTSTPAVPRICAEAGQILLCASSNAMSPVWKWTATGFSSSQQCIVLTSPSQSGVYTAAVTDGVTGCKGKSAPIPVDIFPKPVVDILQTPLPPYYVGDDVVLCANSNASNPDYHWSGPFGFSSSALCAVIQDAGVLQSGTYLVTVTDVNGCTGTDQVVIEIKTVSTVDPVEEWGLRLSPNPGTGWVQIQANTPLADRLSIGVFDSRGTRVRDTALENSSLTLDLSGLSPGVYQILVSDGVKAGLLRAVIAR